MSLRPILIHPDPRLKKICAPVTVFDVALARQVDDMLETMYDAPGVGLAAPQIGILNRVLVMDCTKDETARNPMALINPVVTWTSEETNVHEEGCLSIPEIYAEITRPKQLRVRWQDINGASHEQLFDGLWATCVQHEIDHLNGKLFIDYLGPVKRGMITTKMKKLKAERARS